MKKSLLFAISGVAIAVSFAISGISIQHGSEEFPLGLVVANLLCFIVSFPRGLACYILIAAFIEILSRLFNTSNEYSNIINGQLAGIISIACNILLQISISNKYKEKPE